MSNPIVAGADGIWMRDSNGDVMFLYGDGEPTATESGYALGCIYQRSDGAEDTTIYMNTGSATSTTWTPVTDV